MWRRSLVAKARVIRKMVVSLGQTLAYELVVAVHLRRRQETIGAIQGKAKATMAYAVA